MIAEQADRCKKIVAGLLHFARQNKLVRNPADVRDLVERALRTIHVPENVAVKTEHQMDDPIAEVDRDQIVQVLANLDIQRRGGDGNPRRHAHAGHDGR